MLTAIERVLAPRPQKFLHCGRLQEVSSSLQSLEGLSKRVVVLLLLGAAKVKWVVRTRAMIGPVSATIAVADSVELQRAWRILGLCWFCGLIIRYLFAYIIIWTDVLRERGEL